MVVPRGGAWGAVQTLSVPSRGLENAVFHSDRGCKAVDFQELGRGRWIKTI